MVGTFLSTPLKDEVERSAMCTLREIVKPCVVLACRKYDGVWHEESACFTLRYLNEANFHLLSVSSFGWWKPPPDYLIMSWLCDCPRNAWISAQIANRIPYGALIAGSRFKASRNTWPNSKWVYGLFWLTDRIFNFLFVRVLLQGTTPEI